jgi:hypothetical protein
LEPRLSLTDFHDLWAGETVWVVGSSGAWGWLDPRFFDGKQVIAINSVAPHFGLHQDALSVSQYHGTHVELRKRGWNGVVFEPDRPLANHKHKPRVAPDQNTVHLRFPDTVNYKPFCSWPRDHAELVQGGTSLHPAMHLAAYMGAASVVTVAADHGHWGGKRNGDGYPSPDSVSELIPKWERESRIVASRLREWGVNVYTMLPFVNVNAEGVSFRGPSATIG